jgi:Membrane carboxypeptidase/penicillin-binding protein
MKTNKQTSSFRSKFAIWFWSLFGVAIISIVVFFALIANGVIGYLPQVDELQNPINKYATEVYSSDLQLLGRYSLQKNNRMKVEYNEISPFVINALLATEDERFYNHSGVDGKALVRSIVKTAMLQDKSAGGGSTITQQLAKLLWSPKSNNVVQRVSRKPIEWVISVKLEKLYTKEEIITMYLNMYDWLNNAAGIKTAAQVYFGITPDKLNVEQSATLVGMLQNSSLYNPIRRNEQTRNRRNVVINQMLRAKQISQVECDSLKQLPLVLNYHHADHKEGIAPYLRQYLQTVLSAKKPQRSNYASWQDEKYKEDLWQWENNPLYGFCNKNTKPNGDKYNLFTDGLKIYTTIDSRMQTYAENAVKEHIETLQKTFFKEKKGRSYAPYSRHLKTAEIDKILERSMRQSDRYLSMKKAGVSAQDIENAFKQSIEMQVFSYDGMIDTIMSPLDSIRYYKHFLRCGFMSIDAKSGHVKAYVGGPDFTNFQYDMVTLGKRQVGSTVKPFLYTLAMEEGMQPCDEMLLEPITLIDGNGRPWTPRNASKSPVGTMVSLRWGLTNSNNWVSAYLMKQFTPNAMAELMRSFGVRGQIDPVVSLCLGPCEVSVAEMVDAYTAFPNKGIRTEPLYVSRIEDANGNVIATFTPKMHEIFSETTAYKMIYMMRAVVEAGSGNRIRRIYGINSPVGGKTGTTQNNSDGWFVGYTPSLVAGVWVGGEDRDIHFDSMNEGQGASMALPIWALYMKQVLANPDLGYSATEQFDIPKGFNPNAYCDDISVEE